MLRRAVLEPVKRWRGTASLLPDDPLARCVTVVTFAHIVAAVLLSTLLLMLLQPPAVRAAKHGRWLRRGDDAVRAVFGVGADSPYAHFLIWGAQLSLAWAVAVLAN